MYLGYISYCVSKESEPYISNGDDLREIENNFGTNPVELRYTNDTITHFSLKSGDVVSYELKCIYDF